MLIALVVQATLTQALDAELSAAQLQGAVVAAYVRSLDGAERYQRNASVRMTPASNQKLLTAAYALRRLGPNGRFTINIWKYRDGWFVDTGGHPTLTYADLCAAREKLRIRRTDTLYLRTPYAPQVPPTWEWDDLPNKYAAQPSAFTVDRGSFELWGSAGKAQLRPTSYGVRVLPMGGSKPKVDYNPVKGLVKLYGPISKSPGRIDTLAVPDPELAAASVLGGRLTHTSKLPPNAPPALTLTSERVIDIVTECLQKSDNNLAENLLLSAAAKEGPLGSDPYKTATERLKGFLVTDCGCDPQEVRPIDGCGLSRQNLVTAKALARVLVFARSTWGDAWMAALATSGKGTLENRLSGTAFKGKTGSLNSVSALSGYSVDSSGNPLVIILVFNQLTATSSEIRSIQDSIVRKIESSRDGTVFDDHDHREGRDPDPSHYSVHRNWRH